MCILPLLSLLLPFFPHCYSMYIALCFCVWRSFIAGKETTSDVEEEEEEIPEYLRLHQLIVEEIGKICRKVNQVNLYFVSFYLEAINIIDLHYGIFICGIM